MTVDVALKVGGRRGRPAPAAPVSRHKPAGPREAAAETLAPADRVRPGVELATGRSYAVSYAWNDKDGKGPDREEPVRALEVEAKRHGIDLLRDRTHMRFNDSIDAFIRRLTQAERVVVILSGKYLRSTYCVAELFTVAILVLLLLQVPPDVVSFKVAVVPRQMEDEPEIPPTTGVVIIVMAFVAFAVVQVPVTV